MKKVNNLISDIDISSPVDICIEVKGILNKDLSEVLGGLNIRNHTTSDGVSISHIEGVVSDQAALIGIMNALYNMRFPIINVKMNND